MAELYKGEVEISPGLVMTSRNWAADTLHKVAEYADSGCYPHDISAFDLGRALARAMVNCNEEDWYKQMLRGILRYETVKDMG
jgi:hypothetical protein